VILWAVFVVIRLGNFVLANLLGANLAEATGLILPSFGVNRLVAIAVVRRGGAAGARKPSRITWGGASAAT